MTTRRTILFLGLTAAVGAVLLTVLSPPAFMASWFARELPSPVAGDPVPPIVEEPNVRIAAAGDTGTGGVAEHATARRMVTESRETPYDALVLLGDLVYETGDSALVHSVVTEPFSPLIETGTELIPVLGDHDYGSGEQQEILRELSRQTSWYADQVGPVRMLVLDSNRVDDPEQTRWLRDTLATPQPGGTWTVAAMHHPAYSAGYHGSDLAVRQAWGPLFAEYDVPLVLAGHDHDYQRSLPQDGVTYVVSGGGAKLRPTGAEAFTAVSASSLHYLDLLFYNDRIVGRAIDQQGHLLDEFTIERSVASDQ
ncbi:MAG: metallophosphoesterase [Propionibacteriales bacterium]|nr:metallophosphoesterase [Propionibacteriales bacterium]